MHNHRIALSFGEYFGDNYKYLTLHYSPACDWHRQRVATTLIRGDTQMGDVDNSFTPSTHIRARHFIQLRIIICIKVETNIVSL